SALPQLRWGEGCAVAKTLNAEHRGDAIRGGRKVNRGVHFTLDGRSNVTTLKLHGISYDRMAPIQRPLSTRADST
ncbi:hypothetical protein CKO51_32420, partial [Rhodopirellula sp. SM50]